LDPTLYSTCYCYVYQAAADAVLGWHRYTSALLPYLSSHHNAPENDDDTETDFAVVKRDVIQVNFVYLLITAAIICLFSCLLIYIFLYLSKYIKKGECCTSIDHKK